MKTTGTNATIIYATVKQGWLAALLGLAAWLLLMQSPLAAQEAAEKAPPPPPPSETSADTVEAAAGTAEAPAGLKKKSAAGEHLPWAAGLAAGRKQAEGESRPLLVRVGAPWCGWCKKLAAELEQPAVQEELRRWTLAYVDSDDAPADARQLGVGPIPALRVVSAAGNVVAEQDGYLAADELLAWLKAGYDQARPGAADVLVASGPPDAAEVGQLIAAFADRSVPRREAAMRRLLAHPAAAAPRVTDALRHEKLSVRLAALELLSEWHAPVDSLDPWRPETLAAERLQAVHDWSAAASQRAPGEVPALTPEQLTAALGEIDRWLAADDDQAAAIGERLARLGPRLLPTVAERLQAASDDRARERLLALRYRLVATNSLVLQWPAGLKRLASGEVKIRRQAAEELVQRATGAEQPLLQELFSDPDPLVREISLRGLQRIGGDGANAALVKLLDDPDPNVRAAVLKQLADDPDAAFAARVAQFAKREPDADLVVHAVRYLKAAPAPAVTAVLIDLLKHSSWQVRAEAAEALGEKVSARSGDVEKSADIFVALIEALADEDGFVASRAIRGLQHANLVVAVKPLAKAAEAHPELAAEIVKILVGNDALRKQADAELRKFTRHADPRVRASALAGLVAANEDDGELALLGLGDGDSTVRKETATSLFGLCEAIFNEQRQPGSVGRRSRPSSSGFGDIFRSLFGGGKTEAKAKPEDDAEPDADAWLKAFRAGKGRPDWMTKTVEPLKKMLPADAAAERLAAALALTAIQGEAPALGVLREIAKADAVQRGAVAPALPFLLWPERQALFVEIVAGGTSEQQIAQLCERLAASGDGRAAALFWNLLAGPEIATATAAAAYQGLTTLYRSNDANDPFSDGGGSKKTESSDADLTGYAEKGTPWQRNVALALLIGDSGKVVELARPIFDDPQTAEDFRADALQLMLVALGANKGEKMAVEQLASKNPRIVKMAVSYLVRGPESVHALRDSIYLSVNYASYSIGDGQKIEVEPPAGLSEEQVRPLLASDDPQLAAGAGYLLATLGNADGLAALLRQWRDSKTGGDSWARPVYRAISALDDDSQTPILREIDRRLNEYTKRDFYWTIRTMHGPDVLKLRKEIRDEVGMERLR